MRLLLVLTGGESGYGKKAKHQAALVDVVKHSNQTVYETINKDPVVRKQGVLQALEVEHGSDFSKLRQRAAKRMMGCVEIILLIWRVSN